MLPRECPTNETFTSPAVSHGHIWAGRSLTALIASTYVRDHAETGRMSGHKGNHHRTFIFLRIDALLDLIANRVEDELILTVCVGHHVHDLTNTGRDHAALCLHTSPPM